ncbi:hypothetical protein OJ996_25935 [Luteolibacter sp. GHJ8]|uniref:Uncharacterized protein n=1 Tax=Luteolibacter rhizosphaerae TaxID=2989719 RepID=A0ABT3GBN2_9BACT|nr:hypothetical protein [Luteolibacter rhizosphaerae]MCW1917057.1 hypothetical protein [Luteolibacter rhizosphaerae]
MTIPEGLIFELAVVVAESVPATEAYAVASRFIRDYVAHEWEWRSEGPALIRPTTGPPRIQVPPDAFHFSRGVVWCLGYDTVS